MCHNEIFLCMWLKKTFKKYPSELHWLHCNQTIKRCGVLWSFDYGQWPYMCEWYSRSNNVEEKSKTRTIPGVMADDCNC